MIKPITKSDLSDCLNILKMSYEDGAIRFSQTEENCPYRGRTRLPLSELEREISEGCQMYGYIHNNELVGFLSLIFADDVMGINDIAILPEYQNNGFGNALMRFSKEEAVKRKCKEIRLGMIDDNIQLKKWYEKHGFKTVSLVKYDLVTYNVGKMKCII